MTTTKTAVAMLGVDQLGVARGSRMIVDGINLSIEPGWALQIHGPNGSGKTTLLRVFAGLLPPTIGQVFWYGVDVHAQRHVFRRAVAYVGHRNGVSDDLSVLENIRFATLLGETATNLPVCACGGWSAARRPEQEVLERAGLLPLQHTRLGQLSQGQRRRVALVRLMLERKPLWLLDEPADGLDSAASAWLDECIAAQLDEGGIVVATTHRPLTTAAARTRHLHLERSTG